MQIAKASTLNRESREMWEFTASNRSLFRCRAENLQNYLALRLPRGKYGVTT